MTDNLVNAAEIYDGQRWYYNIERGSVEIDQARGFVSFVVRWGRGGPRKRITLGIDQIQGIVQPG